VPFLLPLLLHFLALPLAGRRGWTSTLADFQAVSDRVPFVADLKPSGKYVMEDVHKVGGTPAVLKYLLDKGLSRWNLHDRSEQHCTVQCSIVVSSTVQYCYETIAQACLC